MLNGFCKKDEPITLKLRGGDLTITYRSDNNHIIMSGPAETVFDGEIKL